MDEHALILPSLLHGKEVGDILVERFPLETHSIYVQYVWAQYISNLWKESSSFIDFLWTFIYSAGQLLLVEPSARSITYIIAASGAWIRF